MYTVMIVDDERLIREGLQGLIDWEAQGFRVVAAASDGQEALERLEVSPVDLVVADIRMPRMDGLEFLEALRRRGDEVRFLILSGYAEFPYAQRASGLRIDGYLLKPIDEVELVRRLVEVRRQLDGPAPQASVRERRPNLDLVKEMLSVLESRYAENLKLEALAEVFQYTSSYLGKLFRQKTGESFNTALDRVRVAHAQDLLRRGFKVHQVAEMVGYRYVDYFHTKFKKHTGVAPSRYRDTPNL